MPRKQIPVIDGVIGRPTEMKRISDQLNGSKLRGGLIGHILLTGPSGVGKSYMMRAVVRRSPFGTQFFKLPPKPTRKQLRSVLLRADEYDFIQIDEAHLLQNLERQRHDLMYVIDNGVLPPCEDDEPSDLEGHEADKDGFLIAARPIFVLATNHEARLPGEIRNRIDITEHLDPFEPQAMARVVAAIALTTTVDPPLVLTPKAVQRIVSISRGIPRTARKHINQLVNHAIANCNWRPGESIGKDIVDDYLRFYEIDARGLERQHRKYLALLKDEAGLSVKQMAGLLAKDEESVQLLEIELIQHRLIERRTGVGRSLTQLGRAHFENPWQRMEPNDGEATTAKNNVSTS